MIGLKQTGPWGIFAKWFDKYDDNLKQFFKEAERDYGEKVLSCVKRRLSSVGEEGEYKSSLSLVKVRKRNLFAIYARQRMERISKLDPKNYVIYFRPKKDVNQSPLARELIQLSPFYVGLITEAPRTLDVIYRRVGENEVEKTREKNESVIKKIHRDIESAKRNDSEGMRLVEYGKPDLEFFAIRLEKGYPGFKKKPHWEPAIRRIGTEITVDKETEKMFSEADTKKRKRKVLGSVDESKMSDRLADKVLQKYTVEVD